MEMSETKTVPTYPTDDMWEAFFLHHHANDSVLESRSWYGDFGNFAASYAAMLSAAPNIAPEGEFAQRIAHFGPVLKRIAEVMERNDPGHDVEAATLRKLAELIREAQEQRGHE